MKKVIVASPDKPVLGPYSPAVDSGDLVFISGQIPLHPVTKQYIPSSIEEETDFCLQNLGSVLKLAGLGYDNIVKTTIYLTTMEYFEKVNEVYARYFQTNHPARVCIAVQGLPKNCKIEIEAIATHSV